MHDRLTYKDVFNFIESSGDTLISKEYSNTKTKLQIQCGKCNKIFQKTYNAYKKRPCHIKALCGKKQISDSTKKVCYGILHPEGKILGNNNFYVDATNSCRLATYCKECSNKKGKIYRKTNGDKTKDKFCKQCDKEYKVRPKQIYCSKACKGLHKRITYIKTCPQCEKEYKTKNKIQQYCSKKMCFYNCRS